MLDKTNFFSWLQFITAINDMQEKICSIKENTTPLKNCPIYDLFIPSINYSIIC